MRPFSLFQQSKLSVIDFARATATPPPRDGPVGEGEEDGGDADVLAGAAGLRAHEEERPLPRVRHHRRRRPGLLAGAEKA